MEEIRLSLLAHGPDVVGELRPLLDQFSAEHNIRIEEKLYATFESIWKEVFAESQPDVSAIIARHLEPLADRLESTLSRG